MNDAQHETSHNKQYSTRLCALRVLLFKKHCPNSGLRNPPLSLIINHMKIFSFCVYVFVLFGSHFSYGHEIFPDKKDHSTGNYYFVLYKSYNKHLLDSDAAESASLILEHYRSIRSDLNNNSLLFHTLEINVYYLLLQHLPEDDLDDFSVVNNIDSVIQKIIQGAKETECFHDTSFRNKVFIPFEKKLMEIYKKKNLSKKVALLSDFSMSTKEHPLGCVYYVELWNSFSSALLDQISESE
ncbi:MAG: hypothetical protein JJU29_12415 [Verrucomicrobia bacterium]|nr:hypothetical protein [Verrucomicrobiota bacterium]MCH8512900.1 hypothetical protein [Kiritimatiellia bacterium]